MGFSGAAVISFQGQITFPAAKDVFGLNKNGNSQQIERSSCCFPLQTLASACGQPVSVEGHSGCIIGCSSDWKAGAWRAAAKLQLLSSSRIWPQLLARPFSAPWLTRATQP